MISITQTLNENKKIIKNPKTILIQNKYYPNGLTEEDVFNYYRKNKKEILNQTKNREIILFLAVSKNNFIVRRYSKLNKTNYDKLIHPRVVSIHSCMGYRESFGIIDVDCDDFDKAKDITYKIYLKLRNTFPKISIRFTGKTSFHIFCPFVDNLKRDIDDVRITLKRLLERQDFNFKHTIKYKRTNSIPNLDLAPNKKRGGFITLNSLSILGLKCIEVNPKNMQNFSIRTAKI